MSEFYRVDCKKWATTALKSGRFRNKGKLVKISPRSGRVLGGVKVPNGKTEYPDWFHHYAVELEGNYYDAAYPNGLAIAEFKQRFLYQDEIIFELV